MPEAQINILKAFSHKEIRSLSGESASKLLHCLCADYWNVLAFHFFLCVWLSGLTGSVLSQAGSVQTESSIHGQIKFM